MEFFCWQRDSVTLLCIYLIGFKQLYNSLVCYHFEIIIMKWKIIIFLWQTLSLILFMRSPFHLKAKQSNWNECWSSNSHSIQWIPYSKFLFHGMICTSIRFLTFPKVNSYQNCFAKLIALITNKTIISLSSFDSIILSYCFSHSIQCSLSSFI